MSSQTQSPLPEAPASATFKYVDPATGGEVMFTLRSSDGVTLLGKVRAALDHLVEQEAEIVPPRSLATRFAASSKDQPIRLAADTPPICKQHGQAMKASKFGGFYCPLPDETTEKGYCRHRVTKAGHYKAA
ncbi:MAG: hypothetical protein KDD73_16785 [Anaerolineales bacterium]|nr:hypothetical protein [Anaerolineales bacterium]